MKIQTVRSITYLAIIWSAMHLVFIFSGGAPFIIFSLWIVGIMAATGFIYFNKKKSLEGQKNSAAEDYTNEAPILSNCPINEQTGDGDFVGRCWFALDNGSVCPRHGDVKSPCNHYLETNELTPEEVHKTNQT